MLGQIDTITTTQGLTDVIASNLSYQPFGPLSAMTYGNALTHTRAYDLDYRLTGLMTVNGNVHQDLGYLYDNANNITQIINHLDAGRTQGFQYDELNRLTNATGIYGDIDYTYDPTGNRTSKTVDVTTETYTYATDSHHLLQTTNGTTTNYSYDLNGNTLSNTDYEFVYNDSNRLAEVKQNNVTIAQYTYNGKGERTKKESTEIVHYIYDQFGRLIVELDGTGTTVREYIYLNGEPLAQIYNGNIYYYHNNHIGTPQAITDQSQATVWEATYKPFGEATIHTETITNNIRGIGQYHDVETGDNYNVWRYLDLELGRYRTSDRIGLGGGLNTYSYVSSNPINFYDPMGLACVNVNGRMTCSLPGGPSYTLPAPPGFPNQLGADDFLYHEYSISRDLDGADPECVFEKLVAEPTPGKPRPATEDGTPNNAETPVFGDNWVRSYTTTAHGSGIPLVVNTAGIGDGSDFGPGYVVRYVNDGRAYTSGEGADWAQSPRITTPYVQDFGNWLIWGLDLERIIEECKCKK